MSVLPYSLAIALSLCLYGAVAVAQTSMENDLLRKLQNALQEQQGIQASPDELAVPTTTEQPEDVTPLKAMTLEQALKAAIERNPDLKAARAQLGIADAAVVTAAARLNPAIVSENGVAEQTYRLGVEQTLELGGKRRKRVLLAKAQRETALATLDSRILDLRTTVRQAYTRLYNAKERCKTYQNILEVAQELVHIARKREMAGDIAKLDTLQTEILSVKAGNDLQFAESEALNAQSHLNALLNQPLTTKLSLTAPSLTPQISTPPAPDGIKPGEPMLQGHVSHTESSLSGLIELANQQRPEIRKLLREIQVAEQKWLLARANRIPDLTIVTGAEAVISSGQKSVNAFVTGRMDLPLRNRQQGPIQEALATKAALEAELEALKKRISLEVAQAYTAFQANRARLQRYETQLLPYAVAIVEKSRRAFEEGKAGILTAIDAQRAYMDTRLGYLQAMMDTQESLSELEKAVGAGL